MNLEGLENLPINPLDVGVLLVLLISAVLAYARGFVHEVLSVGGWIGAIFATFYGFPYLRPIARKYISLDIAADLTAGVVIFITTLVILSVLTRAISKQVQASALNVLDRSLGFLFGLARGAVLICVAYIGLELLVPQEDQPAWIRDARSMQLIVPGANFLKSLVPDDVAPGLKRSTGKSSDLKDGGKPLNSDSRVKELTLPTPKSTPSPAREGYDANQRKSLERLMDGGSNR